MIVGGAVVLMLTTKRGRQILKEVTDGGIEGIDQYIDIDKIKALTSEFDDEDLPAGRQASEPRVQEQKIAKSEQDEKEVVTVQTQPRVPEPQIVTFTVDPKPEIKKVVKKQRKTLIVNAEEPEISSVSSTKKPRLFKRKKK
jgi:hypothetical protein